MCHFLKTIWSKEYVGWKITRFILMWFDNAGFITCKYHFLHPGLYNSGIKKKKKPLWLKALWAVKGRKTKSQSLPVWLVTHLNHVLSAKKDYDQFSFFTDVYEFSDTRRESDPGFHKNTLKLKNLFLLWGYVCFWFYLRGQTV